jgi:hypothetical protein
MPAEKFLFPQRTVRADNPPKPGGYLGNVEWIRCGCPDFMVFLELSRKFKGEDNTFLKN